MNAFKRAVSAVLLTATLTGSLTMGVSATSAVQTAEAATTTEKSQNVITEKIGDWFQDTFSMIRDYKSEATANAEAVKNSEFAYGTVTADKVNLRTGPSTEHRVVAQANENDSAFVLGKTDKWYKVICNGRVCYIHSSFLEVTEPTDKDQASAKDPLFFIKNKAAGILVNAEALTKSLIVTTIITNAKEHIGTRYVFGGSKPGGFDCSGFTQYIFAQSDISIPRSTTEQYRIGTYVEKSELQPGDLVFFANTYRKGISHVGIYIGDGNMIHASSSKGITIASLSSNYNVNHYYGARRIV